MIIDKKQLRDDIEKRKELPEFGISSDKNIQRLRIITETRRSFTPEVVEALLDELESLRSRTQSVPSEMTPIIEDGEIIAYERHGERFNTIIGATWNTCRATMLQAGNSPVTPYTWIPVSERMPPNKPGSYEYIVFDSLNNKTHHDYWNVPDGSCDDFSPFWNHYGNYVTHWMPLPAAPQQQEVKSRGPVTVIYVR